MAASALAPQSPAGIGSASCSAGPTIGVILSDRMHAGLVEDGHLQGSAISYPETPRSAQDDTESPLIGLPTESLVEAICDIVLRAAGTRLDEIQAIGVALPGLTANGVVQEAPNLPQLKGARIGALLASGLAARGSNAPVQVINDADAMAAGLACTSGKLDKVVRVWTLGTGIGYGHYPFADGVWEGGHTCVTLDDKENYCGCGGKGHLEGIMGHRAMRLRFLDMEPEEIFEAANRREDPDPRCVEFKQLWHRGLAAATASAIHIGGTGKFFITGYNVRFLDMNLLRQHLKSMVKMSSLQAYSLEIVPEDQSVRILGSAIAAQQMAGR